MENKSKTTGSWRGIGPHTGRRVGQNEGLRFACKECGIDEMDETAPLAQAFTEMLTEWYFSGDWVWEEPQQGENRSIEDYPDPGATPEQLLEEKEGHGGRRRGLVRAIHSAKWNDAARCKSCRWRSPGTGCCVLPRCFGTIKTRDRGE